MPIVAPTAQKHGRTASLSAGGALDVLRDAQRAGELVHLTHIPGEAGEPPPGRNRFDPRCPPRSRARGIAAPWTHQAQAAGLALAGRSVILATRAASGKSAGYLAAALTEVLGGGTVLYIAPTKLAARGRSAGSGHVLAACAASAPPATTGDATDRGARLEAQSPAQLSADESRHDPQRAAAEPPPLARLPPPVCGWWIIDECHGYRGVFGSHVAQVLRRLRRVAATTPRLGSRAEPSLHPRPSATIADPVGCARQLHRPGRDRGDR